MSRTYTILALIACIIIWMANSSSPPNQKTDAPGEGSCSDCHTINGGTQDGTITLTGIPAMIEPGADYVLTITNSNPNGVGVEAGFEITILNNSNNQAGTMSMPSMFSTLANAGGRQYWKHFPAQAYPANDMVSWTVTWAAPTAPEGTVITAYCIGNIANGNNQTTGDLIVTSTATGTMTGGGPILEAEITAWTDVLCFGGSNGSATVTASGGVPPYSYSWSNGGNTATINNLQAGTYSVTVTDASSNTATASIAITQPSNLVLQTPNITHVSCNGGNNGSITASATGGTPPYDYNWSNGGTTATISNLSAGSYTVTVMDDNGCTKSATYMVTQPAALVINLESLNHESCAGENDGSITISVTGGAPPVFAEWSNGAIGNTITDLEPDTYSVTVTDNNDCTKTATYTINPGGVIDVDLVNIVHVSCNGGNDGSVTVSASGGEAPYMYMWSNGASGPSNTNLAAGNYLLTVTDNNGCENVSLYTINQPGAIAANITQTGVNLCAGDTLVDLTSAPTGGMPPYTGSWSTGQSGLSLNNVGAGTYTITVTDSDGCTATGFTSVTEPPLLTVLVTTTDETSAGANDGTATATPAGGTAAYTYLWSNGGVTSTITGLAPGTYTVTVTDMNGCQAIGSGQVDAFGCVLNVELAGATVICTGGSALIQSSVTGGNGVVTYLWSTGEVTSEIIVTTAGVYCVTVSDESGCQDMACIEVIVHMIPDFVCPVTNESAPGANDGAVGCDSIPGATYLWDNGATTAAISGLAPGQYCLTVTDILTGCSADECFTVQAGNCALVVTAIITDVLCAGGTTGHIDVSVENATPPVTFTWSNGSTTSSSGPVSAGTYTVSIIDGAGCIDSKEYTVSEPAPLTLVVDEVQDITDIPGHVLITVSGGIQPYVFLWTNPMGAQNANEDQLGLVIPGTYSVLVTDGNGCTIEIDSIEVEFDVAAGPEITFTPLIVYPVPTDHTLYLKLEHPATEVIINGIDGRTMLHTRHVDANRVDVSVLESGWYILRISDGTHWYIARMVK